MAVTHPTPVRDGICNFVVDQLDEGTPPGKLIMQTSGSSNVAQLVLSTTAFGASTNGIATAAAITPSSNLTSAGTIAKAVLNNAAGSNKILCSVTATGGGGPCSTGNCCARSSSRSRSARPRLRPPRTRLLRASRSLRPALRRQARLEFFCLRRDLPLGGSHGQRTCARGAHHRHRAPRRRDCPRRGARRPVGFSRPGL